MQWNARNHQASRDWNPWSGFWQREICATSTRQATASRVKKPLLCETKSNMFNDQNPSKSLVDARSNDVQWCPMLRKAADDIKRQFFFQEQGCGIPSANITRLALRPVSCPRLDSCGPSRCSNSFRRAAYDAANARCGAPRFHGLATSSPQDGTENARCGSARGTSAVGVGGTRE
jgi:hypothetical protein